MIDRLERWAGRLLWLLAFGAVAAIVATKPAFLPPIAAAALVVFGLRSALRRRRRHPDGTVPDLPDDGLNARTSWVLSELASLAPRVDGGRLNTAATVIGAASAIAIAIALPIQFEQSRTQNDASERASIEAQRPILAVTHVQGGGVRSDLELTLLNAGPGVLVSAEIGVRVSELEWRPLPGADVNGFGGTYLPGYEVEWTESLAGRLNDARRPSTTNVSPLFFGRGPPRDPDFDPVDADSTLDPTWICKVGPLPSATVRVIRCDLRNWLSEERDTRLFNRFAAVFGPREAFGTPVARNVDVWIVYFDAGGRRYDYFEDFVPELDES